MLELCLEGKSMDRRIASAFDIENTSFICNASVYNGKGSLLLGESVGAQL